jgi:riboflavin synthase
MGEEESMFTGLVEERGRVLTLNPNGDGVRLHIAASTVLDDVTMGASMAVNGVCLTVVAFDDSSFSVDAVPETMDRSNLGRLEVDSAVNLERPVRVSDRLGGHIVQGHVDATAEVVNIEPRDDGSFLYTFMLDSTVAPYVVEKGSITIDGISLTVAGLSESTFTIAIIPHTAEVTTLSDRSPGDLVNIEVDVLAKYVERQLAHMQGTP